MSKTSTLLTLLAVLVVVAVVVVAFDPGIVKQIEKQTNAFGFTVSVQEQSSSPFVQGMAEPMTNSSLSFQKLAENPTVISPQNMNNSGWSGWQISNTTIRVYSGTANIGNTTSVVNFTEVENNLNHPVNLSLSAYLINGRIASYSVNTIGNISVGFIFAVVNGTNYTVVNAPSSNTTIIGRGNLVNGNVTVEIPSGDAMTLYLSVLPNSVWQSTIWYDHTGSSGMAVISV